MRFIFVLRTIGAIALIISAGGVANAADLPTKAAPMTPAPAIPGWTFSLTPYFWATSLTGSTTVKGRTTDVDAGFFQILDHTQFPKDLIQLAAFGEARNGRFALLADLTYMKIGIGASLNRGGGTDALGASVGASAGLTIKMFIGEFAAAYELARWHGLTSAASSTAFDLYAGGRVWWQQADLQILASGSANIFDLTFSRAGVLSAKADVSWVDPVVGARLRHQFAPGWNLNISGDVGGFGAGSKFSWQALARARILAVQKCRLELDGWLQGVVRRLLEG